MASLVPELICSDFERSLGFYTTGLGFNVKYQRPEERFAFLALGMAELMIEQPFDKKRLWPKAPLRHPFGRGVNFQIEVDDVVQLHSRPAVSNAPVVLPLEIRRYRRGQEEVGNWQFAIHDPDGYVLRFFQSLGARALETSRI